MIDLGEAEKIDRAVAKFKKEVAEIKETKGIKHREASRNIYDMVFKPIKNELRDVKEVFISPDGNLNLIPFEVLQGPDGRYLIEDYTFNYLAAGRDLLGFGEIFEKAQKALLMGDPDFDMGSEEKSSTLRRLALRDAKQEKVVKRSTEMKGFHFSHLPGTREEVRAIQDIIGMDNADLYTGKEALEEVLRTKGAPKILHLATHGFFLTDLDLTSLMDESMVRGMQQISGLPIPTGKKARIENPLLRSGIALAGANKALESGDAGKSDGIVTAEKILGFRLRGTEMVVLSACETGVGEVKTGEGVFGLRRAFTQAGAKSLVMSMWSVPDKETRELMIQFYRNILSGKMNRCQALRQAALREMQIAKERHGYANPFYWGAFVFMGEP
jgi:CHAT domain-containing protein